jgi:hypothetical protein
MNHPATLPNCGNPVKPENLVMSTNVSLHRFIQHHNLDKVEYQRIRESVFLAQSNTLRYGNNLPG